MELTSIQNFVGNYGPKHQLLEAIKAHSAKTPCRIMVIGPAGCGKTALSSFLLKQCGYTPAEVHPATISELKQVDTILHNACRSRTIQSYFDPHKQALLLDDLDVLCAQFVRCVSTVNGMFENMNKGSYASIPVVITSSGCEERRLVDIKPHCKIIRLAHPTVKECFTYFMDYLEKQETKSEGDIDTTALIELIKAHKQDIRAIHTNLSQLVHNPHDIQSIRSEWAEKSLFQMVEGVFEKPISLHDECWLYSDNSMLSHILYENMPQEWKACRVVPAKSNAAVLHDWVHIMDRYCEAETVDHHMTKMVYYDFMPYMNCLSLFTAAHTIHKYPLKRPLPAPRELVFPSFMQKQHARHTRVKKNQELCTLMRLPEGYLPECMHVVSQYLKNYTPTTTPMTIPKEWVDVANKYAVECEGVAATRVATWKRSKAAAGRRGGGAKKKKEVDVDEDFVAEDM